MANNIVFEQVVRLSLPVPSGTVSGDPVGVGGIGGIAVTDRDSDGFATVQITGVASVPLASAVTASVGGALYVTQAGVVSATSAAGSAVLGASLDAKSSGSASSVRVLLGAQPAQTA